MSDISATRADPTVAVASGVGQWSRRVASESDPWCCSLMPGGLRSQLGGDRRRRPTAATLPWTPRSWRAWPTFAERRARGVPLERVLWTAGHYAIERLVVDRTPRARATSSTGPLSPRTPGGDEDGQVADRRRGTSRRPRWRSSRRRCWARSRPTSPTSRRPSPPPWGCPPRPRPAVGPWRYPTADHVLLLFLDGFGYVRYTRGPGRRTHPQPGRAARAAAGPDRVSAQHPRGHGGPADRRAAPGQRGGRAQHPQHRDRDSL